jgi:hypothetical protein
MSKNKVKRLQISRDDFSAKMKNNNKGLHIVVDIPASVSQEIQEDLEPLLDFFLKLKKKTEYKVIDG